MLRYSVVCRKNVVILIILIILILYSFHLFFIKRYHTVDIIVTLLYIGINISYLWLVKFLTLLLDDQSGE